MSNIVNFSILYLENPLKVKDFFVMLEKISNSIKVDNLNLFSLVDSKGNTILHNAANKKDLETIQSIFNLIKNIDKPTKSKFIDAQNNNKDTAFHLAVNTCQLNPEGSLDHDICLNIAKLFDHEGASKNIKNKEGYVIELTPQSTTQDSEYKNNILSFYGGSDGTKSQSSTSSKSPLKSKTPSNLLRNNLENITTEVSIDHNIENNNNGVKRKLLENINTEVSVDNFKDQTKLLLENITSDISLDNITESYSGGSTSESNISSSSNYSSSNSTSESQNTSSSMTASSSSDYKAKYKGGSNQINSEQSGLSDTSAFVKTLLTQFNSMKGGSKKTTGQRELPSLSDFEVSEIYGGKDFGLSREQMKESSNLHDQVVKMFVDSGKTEEEARIMKMALYKYTKDKHPELNNLDRAKKMMEFAEDSSLLKKLDLDSTRKIYEEVKKSKRAMTNE